MKEGRKVNYITSDVCMKTDVFIWEGRWEGRPEGGGRKVKAGK